VIVIGVAGYEIDGGRSVMASAHAGMRLLV